MKNLIRVFFVLTITTFATAQQNHSHNPDTSVEKLNTDGTKGIFIAAEELEWVTAFDGFPIQFSFVSGKAFETPHGTFGKFPGVKDFGKDFITPEHIHSYSYQAVVIQGTMINPEANEDPNKAKRMGPGSYWYQPANQVHTTGCVSEEPCIFYMYQPVPFNFVPKTVAQQTEELQKKEMKQNNNKKSEKTKK
jgi:hypothetical protein